MKDKPVRGSSNRCSFVRQSKSTILGDRGGLRPAARQLWATTRWPMLLCLVAACSTAKPPPAVLGRPEGFYDKVAFSPDGHSVAAVRNFREVVVFDVKNRVERECFSPPGLKHYEIDDLAYTPDGRLIAAALTAEAITIWDANSQRLMLTQPQLKPPCAGALSPDGTRLAVSGRDQPPIIWDVISGTKITVMTNMLASVATNLGSTQTTNRLSPVEIMAFSADNRWLATANSDRNVCIWDIASGSTIGTIPRVEQQVNSIIFSPDGRRLAISAANLTVWECMTAQKTQDIAAPTLSTGSRIAGTAWAFIGVPAAMAFGNPFVASPAISPGIQGAANSLSSSKVTGPATFTPDGTHLAIVNQVTDLNFALGHPSTQVRIFNLASNQLVSTVARAGLMWQVAFSPDGLLIATAGKGVEVWDWKKAEVQKGKQYASGQKPYILQLGTNVVVPTSAPLVRAAPKRIRLAPLEDQTSGGPLGAKRGLFGMKANDIYAKEPLTDTFRVALQKLFVGCGHSLTEGDSDLQVSGTIKKCRVETPVTITTWTTTWNVKASIELEMNVTNRNHALVYSAVYSGEAVKKPFFGPTENSTQETCNEALANVLLQIAADPKWTRLQ